MNTKKILIFSAIAVGVVGLGVLIAVKAKRKKSSKIDDTSDLGEEINSTEKTPVNIGKVQLNPNTITRIPSSSRTSNTSNQNCATGYVYNSELKRCLPKSVAGMGNTNVPVNTNITASGGLPSNTICPTGYYYDNCAKRCIPNYVPNNCNQ